METQAERHAMNDKANLISERLEREAVEALHAAADVPLKQALGLGLIEVGDALVSIATHEPSILLNRAIGLGLDEPTEPETLARIQDVFRRAGVENYFLHLHPDARPDGLRASIEAAGLVKRRGWMKFSRGGDAPPDAESDLRIERISPEHAEAFGRIAADGFGMSEEAIPLLASIVDKPNWHVYVSFDGDTPAGTGVLFVDDGYGWLDWGATSPEFRRRGGQRAILARRIRDGLDLGCKMLFTETGEAVEGDPQHSYHNIEWAGFHPDYVRENYGPPA